MDVTGVPAVPDGWRILWTSQHWTLLSVASLTVNVCALIYTVIYRVVLVAVRLRSSSFCASKTKQVLARRPAYRRVRVSVLASAITASILSFASVAIGLVIAASNTSWQHPLFGSTDPTTTILLSVSLGCFVFTIGNMVSLRSHPDLDVSGWTVFRAAYAAVSISCLLSVLVTGDNLIAAVTVLLVEVGMGIEEVTRAVGQLATSDGQPESAWNRLEGALTQIGLCALCYTVVLPTVFQIVVLCVAQQTPAQLASWKIGFLCFIVAFYTFAPVILLRRQLGRCVTNTRRRLAHSLPLKIPTVAFPAGDTEVPGRRHLGIDGQHCSNSKKSNWGALMLRAVSAPPGCSRKLYRALKLAALSAGALPHAVKQSHCRSLPLTSV